ncbi:hypothetical protein CR513_01410, partial [Mucuna pruriens]
MDPAQMNYTTIEKDLLAIIFSLDKFCSYLLGSKIIIFSDHEFDLEIRDKKGAENALLQLENVKPWFADICNFFIASTFPPGASRAYKEKIESDANFVIQHPEAPIMHQVGWPGKYLIVGSIDPPFFETLTNMSRPVNNVNE